MSGAVRWLAVLTLALGLARNAAAQGYARIDDPTHRFYFTGGSVLLPPGDDWVRQWPQGDVKLIFVRGTDSRHTWAAIVSTFEIDTVLDRAALERLARFRSLEGQGRPLTPRSFDVVPDSTLAPTAVRYRYQVEDHKVPHAKGKTYLLEGQGVLMVHPDTPRLVIALEYSERAEIPIPLTQSAAGDSFLNQVALARIDVAGTRSVDVGIRPYLIVYGHGTLWAVCARTSEEGKKTKAWSELLRIDPANMEIKARARVDGGISDLVPTPEAVWASDYRNGLLLRLDPTSLATTATIKHGGKPERMVASGGALWVTDRKEGAIQSVDLKAPLPDRKPMRDLKAPFSLAEVGGSLWIADQDSRTVVSLDPKARALVGKPISVALLPSSLAYGANSLWVYCAGIGAFQRLDPSTRTMAATIPLDFWATNQVFVGGGLWVANSSEGRLMMIDPATNRVTRTSGCVGLRIDSVTASDDGVWVADGVAGVIRLVPLP